ncbi:MAG TPA: zinc-binding dehydrogenase, partial [Saprospiraceae bacterium]
GKKGKLNLIRLGLGFGFFSPISYLGKSQCLIGVNMLKIADHRPDLLETSFKGVTEFYKQGILLPHVGAVFQQDELDKAHAHMEDRKSIGKVVVEWSEE